MATNHTCLAQLAGCGLLALKKTIDYGANALPSEDRRQSSSPHTRLIFDVPASRHVSLPVRVASMSCRTSRFRASTSHSNARPSLVASASESAAAMRWRTDFAGASPRSARFTQPRELLISLARETWPNHALQRTRRGRCGFNPHLPCAGSLSLGRWAAGRHDLVYEYLCAARSTFQPSVPAYSFLTTATPQRIFAGCRRGRIRTWGISFASLFRLCVS